MLGLAALWIGLAVFPYVAPLWGLDYYVDFVRRILILSMAAASLNFLIGRAGLVALGHAGFMGVGAYTVAALAESGWSNAWGIWAMAAAVGLLVATVTGAVTVRTRGVYFIMITLAFAQMLYYVAVSLRQYGGDDGYTMYTPLVLWPGSESIAASGRALYGVVLLLVTAVFWLLARMDHSYFGRALEGVRDNETRMQAMGYPTYALKLCAFAMAGAIAALAGALLATQNLFVSPSIMHWSQSALLIVMVVVGGIGLRWGAPLGVAVWLLLEELLKAYTSYWHAPMGLLLLLVVFVAPKGLSALRLRKRTGEGA